VILFSLLVFALVFSRAEWAPKEKPLPALPREPPVNEQEVEQSRQGLKPLGVVAVLPPLMEDRRQGARVAMVMPGSPAEKAGVRPGDLITSFDGAKVTHPLGLAAVLNSVKPGQPHKLVVLRDRKEQTLTVTGITPLPPEERPQRMG
jgi:S1-C subfamily serine protease